MFNLEGVASETVEETGCGSESYTNNADVLAADLPGNKNPTVLWEYWSNHPNPWFLSYFPGKYHC